MTKLTSVTDSRRSSPTDPPPFHRIFSPTMTKPRGGIFVESFVRGCCEQARRGVCWNSANQPKNLTLTTKDKVRNGFETWFENGKFNRHPLGSSVHSSMAVLFLW